MQTTFRGIIPAIVTPFDSREELNTIALRQLIDRLISQGIGGLFLCGTTGEWWAMSVEERKQLAEAALAAVNGRVPVMIHVGAPATRHSIDLARHAKKAGAAAISTLPPIGYAFSEEAIWNHFRRIGESADLPLYLYHLPQLFGDVIRVDSFLKALETIPNLRGVKFSSYRIDDLLELRAKSGDKLNVISGCSEQLLSATVCGAEGSICTWYNFLPRLGNGIIEATRKGDLTRARELQELLAVFGKTCLSKGIGNIKWLISRRGIDVGVPRSPTMGPTPEEQQQILRMLDQWKILEWSI